MSNPGIYLSFVTLVFFAYWAIAHRPSMRASLLVTVNLLFYWLAAGPFVALLCLISAVDFVTTRAMSVLTGGVRRKLLLVLSLTLDLGVLCVFKYSGFFFGTGQAVSSWLGVSLHWPVLNFIAPLGLSFYVFQSVALVLDCYRRECKPAESYLDHLAFISFFPTITAGPILRAKQLLTALRGPLTLDAGTGSRALLLIATGLTKKIAVADYLSVNLVNRVFDFPERFSSIEVLFAVYGYALQIYADFSGYSDIAVGTAMLLGFNVPANFKLPYRAKNLPEFWRRWHISLSTWLRDYIFFVFVKGKMRRPMTLYAGLVVTMLVGGLWHGPSWTFVLWGLLHGVGLALARAFEALRRRTNFEPRSSRWSRALAAVVTFHFVCLAWVFFRADSLGGALGLLKQISTLSTDVSNLTLPLALLVAGGLMSQWIPDHVRLKFREGFTGLPALAQAGALAALAVGLYIVASTDVVPFIYARF
ncbi:MAG TPA: MBOAT family O-acyltransferase [Blastocatellia bacterium]|nr:MBOAT family O-acyltransferase [Blastocatellia bacterium]